MVISPHHVRSGVVVADREGLHKDKHTHQSSGLAGALEQVESKSMLVWTAEFIASMAVLPVAWIAGKSAGLIKGEKAGNTTKAWVSGTVSAPIEALRNTTLGDIGAYRANVANAFHANAVNSKATELADKAKGVAERWGKSDAMRFDPLAQRMGALEQRVVANTAGAGVMDSSIARLAEWRQGQLARKAEKQAAKLLAAHQFEVPGFGQRMLKAVGMGKEMAPVSMLSVAHGSYSGAQAVMGGSYNAASVAEMMKNTASQLNAETLENLGAAAKTQAGHVGDRAKALGATLERLEQWKGVRQSGMGGVAPALIGAVKRVPLMTAIIGVGLTAGTAAVWLRTREKTIEGRGQLRELAGDVYGVPAAQVTSEMLNGANAPALLKHAQKSLSREHRSNLFSAVMHTGANGLLVGTMSSSGMMGVAAQMGMESMADIFSSENPYLSAYDALKQAETGQGTLEPKKQVALVKMLVATSKDIEAHGGLRNSMAAPIAEQMVAEKLSVRQILQEIGKPEVIAQRAVKVKEAETAAKAAEAAAPAANVNAAPATKVAANINAVPTKVGAVEHQGRVAQQAVNRAHA